MDIRRKIKSTIQILLILTISHFSHAQNKSCLTCSFVIPEEAAKVTQGDPCEDLFEASCLGPDGKSKYNDDENLGEEMSELIQKVRNKTAQSMGYKDADDAIKSKLKETGIALKEPLDEDSWKSFTGEKTDVKKQEYGSGIFSSVEQCEQEAKELKSINHKKEKQLSTLKKYLTKYEDFFSKYEEQSIKFYAKDIPYFFSQIESTCKQSDSLSEIDPQYHQKINEICENMGTVKRKGIDLFRAEGTKNYEKLAEQFVREHLLKDPNLLGNVNDFPKLKMSEADKVTMKVNSLQGVVDQFCKNYSSIIENTGRKIVEDFKKTVSKSKITVDAVIDSVYSKKREKLANEIFQTVRSDIQDLVKSFVTDPKKRGEILQGYDNLKLFWMRKPEDSAYIKPKNGITILDENKIDADHFSNQTRSFFFDPDLSFLKQMNASYSVSSSTGKIKAPEQINMLPFFILLLDKNPYVYLSVIAHETGHKIGPMISKINGHDLTSEYSKLLECYKSNNSIKLETNQKEEVISDYFSSEVLARQIEKLPQEKRKQAVMSAMAGFCIFDKKNRNSISCKGEHPESSLRIGGIFGANPSMRKILGCQKDSSKFKTCGLKTSILNLKESNSSIIDKKTSDGKSLRGTQ